MSRHLPLHRSQFHSPHESTFHLIDQTTNKSHRLPINYSIDEDNKQRNPPTDKQRNHHNDKHQNHHNDKQRNKSAHKDRNHYVDKSRNRNNDEQDKRRDQYNDNDKDQNQEKQKSFQSARSREIGVHNDIINKIKEYEEMKRKSEGVPMMELVKTLKDRLVLKAEETKCSLDDAPCVSCWAKFIRAYTFATYASEVGAYRSVYYLYPGKHTFKQIGNGNLYGEAPKEGYMLEYNFRSKIIALELYNTLMLDYDTEKEEVSIEHIIKYINNVVDYAKTIGVNLAFTYFTTDRGIHIFLLSHKYERSLYWVDFLNQLCNDPWYTAFVYVKGFGIRLTKKPEEEEDIVAEIGMKTPGADYIDIDLEKYPKLLFQSKYLNKDIELRYFKDQYPVIGDINYVLEEQLMDVKFHYLLVQYLRNLSLKALEKLECDIYDNELEINKVPLENLIQDIKQIRRLAVTI